MEIRKDFFKERFLFCIDALMGVFNEVEKLYIFLIKSRMTERSYCHSRVGGNLYN
jgi:hypothetical protein